ncbi:UDP-4-amino-4,6-dideoxy-N-acetyl-beta-L-altrosamine transaminase [Sphaerotilaceae bacterium SBD11-9]
MSHIPYGRQEVTNDDVAAVAAVLRSDWLTQGPLVPQFERAVADACGAAHAVAVNSATSALHVACLALGLGPGDWLWTSPITFLASANCALYCGAQVDFVDIDPRTYNLSAEALATKLAQAKLDGRLPKVVVPVHLAGQSCDMAAIHALGSEYGFRIIEDASHAIGGRYQGRAVGSCQFSDVTVFSFHPVKIITSAEGGMALTQDAQLAERMALFRSHGMTRDPALMRGESDGPWYYEQVTLGYNYRLTDLQAALGLSQLARLHDYVRRRHALAARYDELLANLPLVTPWQHPDSYSGLHLYVVRVPADRRRKIFDAMRAQDIGVNVHYIPVHLQPQHLHPGRGRGSLPQAEQYYAEAISLPMYATLSFEQQDRVVDVLRGAFSA